MTNTQISKYIRENWIGAVFALAAMVALFFFVDAQREIAVLNANLSNQKAQIDQLLSSIDSNTTNQSTQINQLHSSIQSSASDQKRETDKINSAIEDIINSNHLQDILLNELGLKLEFLEAKLTSEFQ